MCYCGKEIYIVGYCVFHLVLWFTNKWATICLNLLDNILRLLDYILTDDNILLDNILHCWIISFWKMISYWIISYWIISCSCWIIFFLDNNITLDNIVLLEPKENLCDFRRRATFFFYFIYLFFFSLIWF